MTDTPASKPAPAAVAHEITTLDKLGIDIEAFVQSSPSADVRAKAVILLNAISAVRGFIVAIETSATNDQRKELTNEPAC